MDRLRGLWDRLADTLGGLWERSPRTVVVAAAVGVTVFALAAAATVVVSSSDADGETGPAESTALSFAVLAGTTVKNTGASVISGDLGISPGTAITGFPPGKVSNGEKHIADTQALQAQADLETAYNDASGQNRPTEVPPDLEGMTLVPGLYKQATALSLTGTLILDAQDDPSATFTFQSGFTLATASNSTIELINGAQACNVFWQVGSSATLGAESTFVGSILALASVTVQAGAEVSGRVLARVGQINLDSATITRPTCDTPSSTGPFSKVAPVPVDSDGRTLEPTETIPTATNGPARTGSTTTSDAPPLPTTDPETTTDTTTTDTTTTDTTTTDTTTTDTTTTDTTTTDTTTTATDTSTGSASDPPETTPPEETTPTDPTDPPTDPTDPPTDPPMEPTGPF